MGDEQDLVAGPPHRFRRRIPGEALHGRVPRKDLALARFGEDPVGGVLEDEVPHPIALPQTSHERLVSEVGEQQRQDQHGKSERAGRPHHRALETDGCVGGEMDQVHPDRWKQHVQEALLLGQRDHQGDQARVHHGVGAHGQRS